MAKSNGAASVPAAIRKLGLGFVRAGSADFSRLPGKKGQPVQYAHSVTVDPSVIGRDATGGWILVNAADETDVLFVGISNKPLAKRIKSVLGLCKLGRAYPCSPTLVARWHGATLGKVCTVFARPGLPTDAATKARVLGALNPTVNTIVPNAAPAAPAAPAAKPAPRPKMTAAPAAKPTPRPKMTAAPAAPAAKATKAVPTPKTAAKVVKVATVTAPAAKAPKTAAKVATVTKAVPTPKTAAKAPKTAAPAAPAAVVVPAGADKAADKAARAAAVAAALLAGKVTTLPVRPRK